MRPSRRLVLSPIAQRDLIEIGDFIAADNPARALTFLAELEATARKAAEPPASRRATT